MGSTPVAGIGTGQSVPSPKVSWLKHVGKVLGRILGFIAKDAAPIADKAASVLEILQPQWAVAIEAGKNLIDNMAKEAVIAEGIAASAGKATGTGAQKLELVLSNVGPAIDQWVAARFPGATMVSKASKAGLVSAVVAIVNELNPATAASPGVPAAPPAQPPA